MTTCGECKHWRKIREDNYKAKNIFWPGPHGECTVIDEQVDPASMAWAMAWVTSDIFPVNPHEPVQNAWTEPSLITKPDFFCALAERRIE